MKWKSILSPGSRLGRGGGDNRGGALHQHLIHYGILAASHQSHLIIGHESRETSTPLYSSPPGPGEIFGISERAVRHLMIRGDLKEGLHWFKKSSRMVLLSVQALEEWIKED